MRADGDREALRLLMIDREYAVQSAKTARSALAAVLVTAPAPLRGQLRPLPRERRAKACAALTWPACLRLTGREENGSVSSRPRMPQAGRARSYSN